MTQARRSLRVHPLLALTVILLLALAAAAVLFGLLSSSGILRNKYGEFGGAAAGFFASLILLHRWYGKMEADFEAAKILQEKNDQLETKLVTLGIPDYTVPPSFTPFIDQEHSLLFCYPKEWRRQPLKLEVQGGFSEDPLTLKPGDDLPGRFNVVVSTPGQQTFTVREVATHVSTEVIEKGLGIEVTPSTESLQVPLERFLELMGVEGTNRASKIYDLSARVMAGMAHGEIRREVEFIDGVESMVVEWQVEREGKEPLFVIQVVSYLEKSDLIVTFTFQDNLGDRDHIQRIRKQVTASTKYW